jgi:putative DNA primase/helicase
MARIDYKELKARVDIVDVIGRSITLKKKGSFFAGCCPFHHDTNASLEVVPRKQIWYCHPCGKGGDVFDFYTEQGHSLQNAAEIVAGNMEIPRLDDITKTDRPRKPQAPEWKVIAAPQITPEFHHFIHGEPSMVWTYRDIDGTILGYTCRFDLEDGGKEVLPYFYCSDGTRSEWRWKGPEAPKPLYGQDRLAANPDATVILVEGEKTADALQAVVPHVVVLTWMGGANGIHKADWSVIYGRKVLVWPDNDWEGMSAAIQIVHLIKNFTPIHKLIRNPENAPRKWDFADCDWDTETTRAYVKLNLTDVQPPEPASGWAEPSEAYWLIRHPDTGEPARHLFLRDGRFVGQKIEDHHFAAAQPEQPVTVEFPDHFEPDYPEPPFEEEEFDAHDRSAPFLILGYEKLDLGKIAYVFYDRAKRVLIRKSTSELTKSAFIELADLAWWEDMFPGSKSAKIDEDMARNYLIRHASTRGLFSTKMVRGRGAWMDAGRVVIHTGDKLIVNGQSLDLSQIDSSYIYELSDPLRMTPENPLPSEEAQKLMNIMNVLPWERSVNASLLAGWCVIAPVCGALKWRPHIWVTGPAGSGKSWVMKSIVVELLGETALQVQGDTTEAGLRQTIQLDAVPVVFDEAEPHDREAGQRINSVLSLMRAASTSGMGKIIKGSAGHAAKSFDVNSCFAMASISVAVDKKSDRSRVTILGLTTKHRTTLEELNRLKLEVINEDFVQRLQARTLSLLPVIIKNSAVFAAAAAEVPARRDARWCLLALPQQLCELRSGEKVDSGAGLDGGERARRQQ